MSVDPRLVGDNCGGVHPPSGAVGIKKTEWSWHTGIFFRQQNSRRFLHLAWFDDLRNDESSSEYAWVSPQIAHERLVQVAAQCRLIWKRNSDGKIPYSLRYERGSRFDLGKLMLAPGTSGFTCATFVLAVFESIGIQLLMIDQWPAATGEDRKWQEWVIDVLKRNHAPAEHVEAAESEMGCARFRPLEVAGACCAAKLPADYQHSFRAGARIDEGLLRWF